ncbi:hypothetical protein ABZ135_02525 [Streptomyces sp. NPDC006339]|uniref:hypothetical protein n=1 Tax=Streptomyces sp. NPDC006339 TaxID=3156755 RepID=UPI0033A7F161
MATPEHTGQADRTEERVSMRDLLASCVAASAVSTPPRATGTGAGAGGGAGAEAAEEREPVVRDEAA